ncbi:oligopeptide transporter 2 [Lipomyces arxii]|uniref:oligopeptide transporter 2 n=1 Tax=Lipomyces arxii TaxID=56418 RepID=UPI0034CE1389
MTTEEGLEVLKEAIVYHNDDLNFPTDVLDKINNLVNGIGIEDELQYESDVKVEAVFIKYYSPYPEVRAVTDPIDDTSIPVETLRAYALGIIWVSVSSFVNEFFGQRQPRLSIETTVVQLLLYPCGKLCELLPKWSVTILGRKIELNPGPWSHKEQMLATMMVSVASGASNFMSYSLTMRLDIFFGLDYISFPFVLLMNFSTLFFGYGIAGLMRRWVIYPVKALWPTVMPTLALNRALLIPEKRTAINGWTITKYKFFFLTMIISFFYFFLPDYLFKALSTFNWMTWIAPNNVKLAVITGSYLGLGFNPITTFDWSVINYSSPLIVPFYSVVNRYVGTVLSAIILIGMYWKNYLWTGYLPINTNSVYDGMGKSYNLSRVMDNGNFNAEGYRNYSPPYMSLGKLVSTGAEFAINTLTFMYIVLTEWKLIKLSIVSGYQALRHPTRSNMEAFNDPHSRMMSKYKEVPDWWFLLTFIISLAVGIVGLTVWPTNTPVWALIVMLLMNIVMLLPTTLVYAVTGYMLGLQDLAIIMAGYMCPDNGVANMLCRVWGFNIDEQADSFIADQKMAHYSKIPQRAVFRAQMLATLLQTFITIGALDFVLQSVPNLCSPTQPDRFVCTFPRSLYSDTLMLGVVGPPRMFNELYPTLKWCFLIGAVLAFPCWLLRKYFTRSMKYVHPVLIMNGFIRWGGTYNLSYYTPGLYASFAFMFYIRRRYIGWWTKYNYVLTSGLSAGVAFGGMFIFLTLQYTGTSLKWWGNNVNAAGVDGGRAAALFAVPPEGFGLKVAHYKRSHHKLQSELNDKNTQCPPGTFKVPSPSDTVDCVVSMRFFRCEIRLLTFAILSTKPMRLTVFVISRYHADLNCALSKISVQITVSSELEDYEYKEKIIRQIKSKSHFTDEDQNDFQDAGTEFLFTKVVEMTVDEGLDVLERAIEYHEDDVNFPTDVLDKIHDLVRGVGRENVVQYEIDVKIEACFIKFHSPYPEVRAVCDPVDDPTIPVETLRAYALGIIWVSVGSFVNEFFGQRQPRLSIQSTVIQLLLYPCGKLCELLPNWRFTVLGKTIELNPGPWTHKEQMLATVMVNIAAGSSNFMAYTLTMRLDMFFGLDYISFPFVMLMNFSTLFFGFGLAGLMRRWVIYPVKAVWPTILPTLALNRALLVPEKRSIINGWSISKYKFFFVAMVITFFYFFFPTYIFRALSTFNWITWIAPQNVTVAIITGSFLGLGFNPISTFDWAVVNYSTPLVVPFFSQVNRYVGMLLTAFAMIGLYWKNYKWTGYLPINSNVVFDSMGQEYNLSRVLVNNEFDVEGYRNYSPPYISLGNLLAQGSGFAIHTLALTYVLLTEKKLIIKSLVSGYEALRHPKKSNLSAFDDPITRMMAVYPEVPDWWFLIVFAVSLAAGIVGITVWPTQTPVWAIIVILVISVVMLLPSCLIYAVTGYMLGFHNLAVIIAGYICPGNGVANMLCRVYGWNIDDQAESYISDQKMAHYSKLPPRAMFRAQLLATVLQTFITIGALDFLIASVPDVCNPVQVDRFVCTFPRSLYADTLMLGVVGPVRMFNALYPALKYCFLVGFLLAFPCWLMKVYMPRTMKYVHPVLIITGVNRWGGTYNLSYYTPGLYASFTFMYYIRRRYVGWWTKYNYVLTSALSAGVAFAGMFIFLTLQYTGTTFVWWGNTVSNAGVDYDRDAALFEVPPEGFGVKIGEFQ